MVKASEWRSAPCITGLDIVQVHKVARLTHSKRAAIGRVPNRSHCIKQQPLLKDYPCLPTCWTSLVRLRMSKLRAVSYQIFLEIKQSKNCDAGQQGQHAGKIPHNDSCVFRHCEGYRRIITSLTLHCLDPTRPHLLLDIVRLMNIGRNNERVPAAMSPKRVREDENSL